MKIALAFVVLVGLLTLASAEKSLLLTVVIQAKLPLAPPLLPEPKSFQIPSSSETELEAPMGPFLRKLLNPSPPTPSSESPMEQFSQTPPAPLSMSPPELPSLPPSPMEILPEVVLPPPTSPAALPSLPPPPPIQFYPMASLPPSSFFQTSPTPSARLYQIPRFCRCRQHFKNQ